jgi:hypothetical protein
LQEIPLRVCSFLSSDGPQPARSFDTDLNI